MWTIWHIISSVNLLWLMTIIIDFNRIKCNVQCTHIIMSTLGIETQQFRCFETNVTNWFNFSAPPPPPMKYNHRAVNYEDMSSLIYPVSKKQCLLRRIMLFIHLLWADISEVRLTEVRGIHSMFSPFDIRRLRMFLQVKLDINHLKLEPCNRLMRYA